MKHFICNLSILYLFLPAFSIAQTPPPEVARDISDAGYVFTGAYAPVQQQGVLHFIDTNGVVAFDNILQQFNAITGIDSDGNYIENPKQVLYLVEQQQKKGITTRLGQWLVPPVYDQVDIQDRRFFVCQLNNALTWYDNHGARLVPEKYTDMGYLDGNYFEVKENGLWGLYSKTENRLVLPCTYQQFDFCGGCERAGNYVMAMQNGKWGAIDFAGNVLVPFLYDHQHMNMRSDEWILSFTRNDKQYIINVTSGREFPVDNLDENYVLHNGFLVWTNTAKKAGLISPSGKQVLPNVYSQVDEGFPTYTVAALPYVTIKKNNLYGLADTNGIVLIPPFSGKPLQVYDTSTIAGYTNGQYSFYNLQGKRTTDKTFSEITWMRQRQVLQVKKNGKYGMYHLATHTLTPVVYDDMNELGGDEDPLPYIKVSKNNLAGLLSVTGKTIIPPLYEEITIIHADAGIFEVQKGEFSGVYDSTGKIRIPVRYTYLQTNYARGFIKADRYDKNDHLVNTFYNIARDSFVVKDALSMGGISAQKQLIQQSDSSYSILDVNTFQQTPLSWRIIDIITNNQRFLKVKQQWENNWQLLEISTGKVLPDTWYSIEGCENGMFRVTDSNHLYGYLNSYGQLVMPCRYTNESLFTANGIATVTETKDSHEYYGFIDTTGKAITPVEYYFDANSQVEDYIYGNYLLLVKNEDDVLMGVADNTGKILVPIQYNLVWIDTALHQFLVNKDKKFGVINHQGQFLLPAIYDDMVPSYISRQAHHVQLSWPLLCRDKEVLYYKKENGDRLPVTVTRLLNNWEQP
ncbi:WG containing repeat-containing protein [Filimonas lacunae]|uniref:WG containing repeat-containing protein n=1 Tax=Filimonas lacunae TaxID=477680 RepID=A0A173MFG9_9BACT|nr:WG repeat-containing protein [Filimonas lacunae]BAV06227.1 hypothetical protein FLA_2243 [Filimonas lacunae]SIT25358.1 WG containing repeat-containing protein [Filimonas lacunae]